MQLTLQIVLPMAVIWALSEWGIFFATYSARQSRQHDRKTLALIIGSTSLAAGFALLFWWLGWGRFPVSHAFVPFIGLSLMIVGLALRWSAILTLKRFFTINVAVLENHQLITHGPYRFIRHPSYTGTLLCLLGIGLALENVLSLLLIFGIPLVALLHRIRVEERVLTDVFQDDYQAYCKRTARLLPRVF